MNHRDRLSGLFWLAISIVLICVGSIRGKIGTFRYPGPGFFPFFLGVLLGLLSMILVVTSCSNRKGGEPFRNLWKGRKWKNAMLVLVSIFAYALLLPRIGYLITTFGMMTVLFGLIERQRLWVQVSGALVTALVTYLVFDTWLDVNLPRGILGF